MPLGDVCVHTGIPILTIEKDVDETDEDLWLEGEPDTEKVPGVPFECFFMDPGEKEVRSPVSGKKITQPTILLESERDDGSIVVLKPEDEIDVIAEEVLLTSSPVRFQVDGGPTPLAAPGDLIGFEVRLKRVRGAG